MSTTGGDDREPKKFFFDDLSSSPQTARPAETRSVPPDEPDDSQRWIDRRGGGTLAGRNRWYGRVAVLLVALVAAGLLVGLGLARQHGKTTTADPGTQPVATATHPTSHPAAPTTVGPRPSPSSPPSRPSAHPRTSVPPTALAEPVTVLNNTTVSGLASRASEQLRGRGWKIASVGNFTGSLPTSTAFYDASSQAQRLAASALAKQFPQITAVQPRAAGLPGSGLTVVVAPNWPS